MVTMKRKERRESAKENGRREKKRGAASFHPTHSGSPAVYLLHLLFLLPLLLGLHFCVSRLVSAPGSAPFGSKHRLSAMGPYNLGVLVAIGYPTTR